MIFGIGCDLVYISRIKELMVRYGDRFLQKVYTPAEINKSPVSGNLNYFAKRFAAKEALAKALGTGIGASISFSSIEILNNSKGKPYFSQRTYDSINMQGVCLHLSLSDEKDIATAYVIIERQYD